MASRIFSQAAFFLGFLIAGTTVASAESISIAWDANTESDLAGYIVSYGTASGRTDASVNVGKTTGWTLTTAESGKTYYFRVVAYNTGGVKSAASAEVSTTVAQAPFAADRPRINFGAVRSGSTIVTFTPPQGIFVTQQGAPFTWTVTSSATWLKVSPVFRTGSGLITAQLVTSALPAVGVYDASITISGAGTKQVLPVRLRVHQAGTTSPPFGSFDTPVNNTTVTGAIPVTGWALDDVYVTKVQIFRDPVGAETGAVYVGDAAFISGARADVETANTYAPVNYRGGWGFMVLTNMLPDIPAGKPTGGVGKFTLHAYATDAEGAVRYLGAKTISAANRGSKKPFGTIDTPGQGAVVSGNAYVNFGWAISPEGTIPADGSTISVLVDGVAVGKPSYNHYRSDIDKAFPGYANSGGAIGYYVIDTTKLTNGLHTIAWVATDSLGNTSGLGSRFFTVLNTTSSAVIQAARTATVANTAPAGGSVGSSTTSLSDVPVENAPVEVRRVAEDATAPELAIPEWTGEITIRTKEAAPIEVRLANQFTDGWGGTYEGYLVVGGEMRPLPAGASLDERTGTFTWQPGAGFLGDYELLFVRKWSEGWKTKIPVRVEIRTGE